MTSENENLMYNYQNGKSDPRAIFQGQHYRITILTERLIRLEYSLDGTFYDGLTQRVINRKFPLPVFSIQEDTKYLEILK